MLANNIFAVLILTFTVTIIIINNHRSDIQTHVSYLHPSTGTPHTGIIFKHQIT